MMIHAPDQRQEIKTLIGERLRRMAFASG